MRKYISVFYLLFFLASCNEETSQHEDLDSVPTDTTTTTVPTFDLSGEFEVLFIKAQNEFSSDNGMQVLTVKDLAEDDTLFFQYKTANHCEECHVEFQIWKNDKYVDIVRDTGFGGEKMFIPASLFLNASKFGTPDYERLSIYLSVRQFHPVETGNKRFLFYMDMK